MVGIGWNTVRTGGCPLHDVSEGGYYLKFSFLLVLQEDYGFLPTCQEFRSVHIYSESVRPNTIPSRVSCFCCGGGGGGQLQRRDS